jgi:glutamyl-tRNA synthetase
MSTERRVRTRFAPSPTGTLHVGNVRSAIFPWLWARHSGGDFILRIEDTDQTRYKEHALQAIFETLAWLEMDIDEGPEGPDAPPNRYFQTQRRELYVAAANQLVAQGNAYPCYCSAERLEALRESQKARNLPTGYDRHCRFLTAEQRAEKEAEGITPVIRFAFPTEGTTIIHDLLRGAISIENRTVDDMILLKSDGLPTYHLAHMVDDHDMGITHVMRGDEYIATYPLHVKLYEALGWELPIYVHLPLILDPSGKGKMSKRKQNADGSVSEQMTMIHEFREAGYLPEAMFNYISLLGWSPGAEDDIVTREVMIERFNVADIKSSPAKFDYEKLEFINGWYIRHTPLEKLAEWVTPYLAKAGLPTDHDRLIEVLPLVQERMKTLAEAPDLLDFFLADAPLPATTDLIPKKMDVTSTVKALQAVHTALQSAEWTHDGIEAALRGAAEQLGLKPGQVFPAVRVAITGRVHAPGIFETVQHIGREWVLERIERAVGLLTPVTG